MLIKINVLAKSGAIEYIAPIYMNTSYIVVIEPIYSYNDGVIIIGYKIEGSGSYEISEDEYNRLLALLSSMKQL